jgi:hypothetical protein
MTVTAKQLDIILKFGEALPDLTISLAASPDLDPSQFVRVLFEESLNFSSLRKSLIVGARYSFVSLPSDGLAR